MTYEATLLQQQNQIQIDWLGVAAAIVGAIIAGVRGFQHQLPARQWVPSTLTGVGVGVFCGPFLAELVGMVSTKASMFMHFTVGLVGYQLADTLSERAWAWLDAKLPIVPTVANGRKGQ